MDCLVMNSVNHGSLRSSDYTSWVQAFRQVFEDWPFSSEACYARDFVIFAKTYLMPSGAADMASISALAISGAADMASRMELLRTVSGAAEQANTTLTCWELFPPAPAWSHSAVQ